MQHGKVPISNPLSTPLDKPSSRAASQTFPLSDNTLVHTTALSMKVGTQGTGSCCVLWLRAVSLRRCATSQQRIRVPSLCSAGPRPSLYNQVCLKRRQYSELHSAISQASTLSWSQLYSYTSNSGVAVLGTVLHSKAVKRKRCDGETKGAVRIRQTCLVSDRHPALLLAKSNFRRDLRDSCLVSGASCCQIFTVAR